MQNSSIFVFGMSVSSVIIPDSESDIPFPIWLPRPKTGNVVIPETPFLIIFWDDEIMKPQEWHLNNLTLLCFYQCGGRNHYPPNTP